MNSRRMFLAIAFVVVLVGFQVETWVLIIGLLFVLWKGAVEYGGLAKPSRWLTNTLTVAFLVLILAKYRTLMGQDASSSFLLLLTSLKLLEERTLRDQKFLLLLGCVLISSLFLYTIELPYLLAGAMAFYGLWSAQNPSLLYSRHFLKALPYVVFLFFFFPRVQNPFGLQGMGSEPGTTGFSDDLNPGSISRIQTSKELAFRVQFLSPRPVLTQDQYWRGQVLRLSEGLRWTKTPTSGTAGGRVRLSRTDYEITLEPHGHRWLFTWDPTTAVFSSDFALLAREPSTFETFAPVRERISYTGEIGTKGTPDNSEVAKIDLQTPQVSDEVRNLAQSFTKNTTDRTLIAESILNFFRQQKFRYSKNPGTGSGTLDGFLFQNKKGYCEHYAASFATLLRLVNVPARVVTGYQGGQYNAYGKFWRFTQADAHAWVEFLNDKNVWQRMDPTSVVAPERIEFGGQLFEDLPEEWIGQNKGKEFLRSRQAWWVRARTYVSDGIESLNYDVILFLIDFNIERQKELLAAYGGWLFLAASLLFLPFFAHSFFRRRRETDGEWLLQQLDQKARALGFQREKSETVRNFVGRWSAAYPTHSAVLRELLAAFEGTQYSPSFEGFDARRMKELAKNLRPKP